MALLEKRDNLIKHLFKPKFKEVGFNVSGTTFIKKEKDFWKLFNIQSSAFNSDENVSIYLNIGFLFPVGFELKSQKVPLKPIEYDCQFTIRTNLLTGRNQWYEIDDNSENLLSKDLNNYILPFFNRYNVLLDCLNLSIDVPKSHTDCRPYIGLTLLKKGELERGNEIIDAFIPTTAEHWAQAVDKFRHKLVTEYGR
jgi:hypothetical protein